MVKKMNRGWDKTSCKILKGPSIYPIKWVKSTDLKRVSKHLLSHSLIFEFWLMGFVI